MIIRIHEHLNANLELTVLKAKCNVCWLSLTNGTPQEFDCIFSIFKLYYCIFIQDKKSYGSIFTEVGYIYVCIHLSSVSKGIVPIIPWTTGWKPVLRLDTRDISCTHKISVKLTREIHLVHPSQRILTIWNLYYNVHEIINLFIQESWYHHF